MENLDNQDENLLRDKMQQHAFQVDEQAWEKMNILLGEEHPPPPPVRPRSKMTGRRWLLGALLGIGWLGWWLMPEKQPMNSDRILAVRPPNEAAIVPATSTYSDFSTAIQPADSAAANKNAAIYSNENQSFASSETVLQHQSLASAAPVLDNNNQHAGYYRNVLAARPKKHLPGNAQATELTKSVEPALGDVRIQDAALVGKGSAAPAPENKRPLSVLANLPPRNGSLPATKWSNPSTVPWKAPKRLFPMQIGLVAGAQLASTPHNTFKKATLAPTFGLSVRRSITAQWSVQVDLLYRSVEYGLEARFAQSRLNVSGLYESWTYVAWANSVEFYELPLLIKRGVFYNQVHVFGGLRPALVVLPRTDSGNSGTFYGTSAYTATHSAFDPTIRKGLRRFDLALTLGGELRLSRRIWLDLRLNQGLLDLTHDDFFHNRETDATTDGQVSLRYYFFSL